MDHGKAHEISRMSSDGRPKLLGDMLAGFRV